mmetsp:Transcript_19765/g.44973  ORF Transcript_19765/g.44973 Transcript_19765/m.44973 type:complete len:217 (+) Transcript_19765:718-1368(+)
MANRKGHNLVRPCSDVEANWGSIEQPSHAEVLPRAEVGPLLDLGVDEAGHAVPVGHLQANAALLDYVQPRGDVGLLGDRRSLEKPLPLQRLCHFHHLTPVELGQEGDAGKNLRPRDDPHPVQVLVTDAGDQVVAAQGQCGDGGGRADRRRAWHIIEGGDLAKECTLAHAPNNNFVVVDVLDGLTGATLDDVQLVPDLALSDYSVVLGKRPGAQLAN